MYCPHVLWGGGREGHIKLYQTLNFLEVINYWKGYIYLWNVYEEVKSFITKISSPTFFRQNIYFIYSNYERKIF